MIAAQDQTGSVQYCIIMGRRIAYFQEYDLHISLIYLANKKIKYVYNIILRIKHFCQLLERIFDIMYKQHTYSCKHNLNKYSINFNQRRIDRHAGLAANGFTQLIIIPLNLSRGNMNIQRDVTRFRLAYQDLPC